MIALLLQTRMEVMGLGGYDLWNLCRQMFQQEYGMRRSDMNGKFQG
jgi:hypothetical protein